MNYEEIRRSAGSLGDVTRLIQTMPGVVTGSDQRNDLIVRGGSPSENLTIVDNIEVPNLNHFAAQGASGGPIGMLNTEFINDASFLAGGFPAKYGGRLSSVLSVELRDGNPEGLSGDLDLGLAGAGGLLEGPIGENASFMVAARRSYLDLLAGQFGLTAIPIYTNYQAKAAYEPDRSNRFWLVSLGGVDDIHFEVDNGDLDDPNTFDVRSGGWRTITGVNWQSLWGPGGYGVLSLSDAYNVYDQEVLDSELGNRKVFLNRSKEGESTLKYDLALVMKGLGEFTAGVSGKLFRNDFRFEQPLGVQSVFSSDSARIDTLDFSRSATTSATGAYVQIAYSITDRIVLTAGARYDYFGYASKSFVSPRAGLSAELLPRLTLGLSYGTYYQMPGLVFVYARPENASLSPIVADHYIAGLSFLPLPDLKISVEGYVKEYGDYPVSSRYPQYSLANAGDEYSVSGRLIQLVSEGSGRSEGVEVYVQKKLTNDFYGQVSYSLSRTRHQALDGIRRPGSFDISSIATIVGGYKINDAWEVSGKFTYASGKPTTPAKEPESTGQNRYILDLSRINADRLRDYVRLDLRADFRLHFEGWNFVTYLEIQNVLNRKNVFQNIWNSKTRSVDQVNQIGFFPFGGFKVEF
jgi:hypothetical protein